MTRPGPERGGIDRRALVARHAITITGAGSSPGAAGPLSVGNGEFCATVDLTGLQTFPQRHPVADPAGGRPGTQLATMAQWGWHRVPGGDDRDLAACLHTYQTPRGPVRYVDMAGTVSATGETPGSAAEAWLRGNPHRLDLARIGLVNTGMVDAGPPASAPSPDEVTCAEQRLDLWTGTITSRYRLRGVPVHTVTACHPHRDALAVRIASPLLADGLGLRIAFPYGSTRWHDAADWTRPDAHRSVLRTGTAPGLATVARVLDGTRYTVDLQATPGARILQAAAHTVLVTVRGPVLEVVVGFTPGAVGAPVPGFDAVHAASAAHWARFWRTGAAVEVADSRDPRAGELERRIVLSQYLTAIHAAGSTPPAEGGLTANSWRGRFHLEMHWWHAAHFALWGRGRLLARSLDWYRDILPVARDTARAQGCPGARWPKQTDPTGRETPSPIGPFLLWQQPHPIYLAELLRRSGDSGRILRRYADLVQATAAFMAAVVTPGPDGYQLGPPVVPAQETWAPRRADITNPTFELAYWAWALRVAQRWRTMLGLRPYRPWTAVATGLARPTVLDGAYAAVATPPYTVADDHPSMLAALGFVPSTGLIDPEIMRTTLHRVLAGWPWSSTWGWDYPVMAMTATRLGEPATALAALLLPTAKNTWLASGHNWQSPALPVYLPGNGGLLAAVALMAAGWDGAPRRTPGFPDDGSWTVHHEGLTPLP